MSYRDISTLINTILHVYMSTQGVLKSIYNGKESILTIDAFLNHNFSCSEFETGLIGTLVP